MGIMAMDMAHKRSYLRYLLLCCIAPIVTAGEWKFDPSISIEETYTDNVKLLTDNKSESYSSQVSARINTSFISNRVNFSLNGNSTYASYSHDHDLDKDFKTLNANGKIALWKNGPALTASASIQNQSRNLADNRLADVVSGDTIETQNYQTGFEYNVANSAFIVNSALNYNVSQSDDNIGESEGVSAQFNAQNGSSIRYVFWQANSNYSKRDNNSLSGENYSYELKLGFYTPYGLTPFVRVYDEDSTGSIGGNQNNNMSSWGPGLKWQLSSHILLDISYNYVDDKKSDDYIAANINWQPSSRTSLQAGLSQRFFGNSYNLNFQHTNRRLANSITYNETIQAFDRNNYQQVLLGLYWCPIGSENLLSCYANNDSIIDLDNYQLIALNSQVLQESNEFSLNKDLSWISTLTLARTSFSLNLSNTERESLDSGIKENTFSASFNISRSISGRSDLKLTYSFIHSEMDKNQIQGNGQEDFYRMISTTYTRSFASSLSANFSIQYLDRDSDNGIRTYQETRAFINIKKNF